MYGLQIIRLVLIWFLKESAQPDFSLHCTCQIYKNHISLTLKNSVSLMWVFALQYMQCLKQYIKIIECSIHKPPHKNPLVEFFVNPLKQPLSIPRMLLQEYYSCLLRCIGSFLLTLRRLFPLPNFFL